MANYLTTINLFTHILQKTASIYNFKIHFIHNRLFQLQIQPNQPWLAHPVIYQRLCIAVYMGFSYGYFINL